MNDASVIIVLNQTGSFSGYLLIWQDKDNELVLFFWLLKLHRLQPSAWLFQRSSYGSTTLHFCATVVLKLNVTFLIWLHSQLRTRGGSGSSNASNLSIAATMHPDFASFSSLYIHTSLIWGLLRKSCSLTNWKNNKYFFCVVYFYSSMALIGRSISCSHCRTFRPPLGHRSFAPPLPVNFSRMWDARPDTELKWWLPRELWYSAG